MNVSLARTRRRRRWRWSVLSLLMVVFVVLQFPFASVATCRITTYLHVDVLMQHSGSETVCGWTTPPGRCVMSFSFCCWISFWFRTFSFSCSSVCILLVNSFTRITNVVFTFSTSSIFIRYCFMWALFAATFCCNFSVTCVICFTNAMFGTTPMHEIPMHRTRLSFLGRKLLSWCARHHAWFTSDCIDFSVSAFWRIQETMVWFLFVSTAKAAACGLRFSFASRVESFRVARRAAIESIRCTFAYFSCVPVPPPLCIHAVAWIHETAWYAALHA